MACTRALAGRLIHGCPGEGIFGLLSEGREEVPLLVGLRHKCLSTGHTLIISSALPARPTMWQRLHASGTDAKQHCLQMSFLTGLTGLRWFQHAASCAEQTVARAHHRQWYD